VDRAYDQKWVLAPRTSGGRGSFFLLSNGRNSTRLTLQHGLSFKRSHVLSHSARRICLAKPQMCWIKLSSQWNFGVKVDTVTLFKYRSLPSVGQDFCWAKSGCLTSNSAALGKSMPFSHFHRSVRNCLQIFAAWGLYQPTLFAETLYL